MSETGGMEPTEESAQTIEAFADYGVSGLPEMLADRGQRVREIVPQIWSMSVTLTDGDLTFTLVASSPEVATLDGVQYAAGGPCEAAVREQREVEIRQTDSPMVEEDWRLFASARPGRGKHRHFRGCLAVGGEHDYDGGLRRPVSGHRAGQVDCVRVDGQRDRAARGEHGGDGVLVRGQAVPGPSQRAGDRAQRLGPGIRARHCVKSWVPCVRPGEPGYVSSRGRSELA